MSKRYSVLSYHPNRSDGFGGIENLVRSFHRISDEVQFEFTELYSRFPNDIAVPTIHRHAYKRVPLLFNSGLLSSINKAFVFFCEARKTKYDLVLTYHPVNLLFLLFLMPKAKVVLVQSNTISTLFEGRLLSTLKDKILRACSAFVVYSEEDKRCLETASAASHLQINIIPRACKLPAAGFKKEFNKNLVTICRIDEQQKNLSEMVKIVEDMPDWTLDIYGVGSTEDVNQLNDMIANVHNVKFCGPSYEVAETLKHYSLFLMTSKYEGFGQTLIEARSQGLPQIVYNTFNAAKNVVRDGETGFLVSYGNREVFKECIERFENQAGLYDKMSETCIKHTVATERSEIEKKWKAFFDSACRNE